MYGDYKEGMVKLGPGDLEVKEVECWCLGAGCWWSPFTIGLW